MKVNILVDGQALELNDFVQKVTFNITSGLINSLRDVSSWSKIEINLEK